MSDQKGTLNTMQNQQSANQPGQQAQSDQESQQEQEALNPMPKGMDLHDANLAQDPVSGQYVDKATAPDTLAAPVNDPNGGTIYFEGADTKAIYEEDPDRFGGSYASQDDQDAGQGSSQS